MTIADWIGFTGVFMILLAYFLNVIHKVETTDLSFILLNLIGAGMSCAASVFIEYWPFIILEGCWSLISLIALIRYFIKPIKNK